MDADATPVHLIITISRYSSIVDDALTAKILRLDEHTMAQYEPITQEHEPSKRQERMSYDPERIRAAEAYAMEELEEDNIHRPGTNRTSFLS